jgi:hypothetical protein
MIYYYNVIYFLLNVSTLTGAASKNQLLFSHLLFSTNYYRRFLIFFDY